MFRIPSGSRPVLLILSRGLTTTGSMRLYNAYLASKDPLREKALGMKVSDAVLTGGVMFAIGIILSVILTVLGTQQEGPGGAPVPGEASVAAETGGRTEQKPPRTEPLGPHPSFSGGTAFVTVGTTKFDALIEAVDDAGVAAALASRGFTRLVVQRGGGSYVPSRLLGSEGSTKGRHAASGLEVEFFEYAPSLAAHLSGAALVISHAGAGSIFETLGLGRPLIAVPNPLLMHNHQTELSRSLAAAGHLWSAEPAGLAATLRTIDPSDLQPYRAGNPAEVAAAINAVVGVGVRPGVQAPSAARSRAGAEEQGAGGAKKMAAGRGKSGVKDAGETAESGPRTRSRGREQGANK